MDKTMNDSTVPAGRPTFGDGERPGSSPGLGRSLWRRRSAAANPGEAGESHHQDARQVNNRINEQRDKQCLVSIRLKFFF